MLRRARSRAQPVPSGQTTWPAALGGLDGPSVVASDTNTKLRLFCWTAGSVVTQTQREGNGWPVEGKEILGTESTTIIRLGSYSRRHISSAGGPLLPGGLAGPSGTTARLSHFCWTASSVVTQTQALTHSSFAHRPLERGQAVLGHWSPDTIQDNRAPRLAAEPVGGPQPLRMWPGRGDYGRTAKRAEPHLARRSIGIGSTADVCAARAAVPPQCCNAASGHAQTSGPPSHRVPPPPDQRAPAPR